VGRGARNTAPCAPLEGQADLDFNLDRLCLPAEADGPLEQWTLPPLVCRGGVASLLHPTEGRLGGMGSTKHGNLHAAACCPGGRSAAFSMIQSIRRAN
jgi:hypothetical protein